MIPLQTIQFHRQSYISHFFVPDTYSLSPTHRSLFISNKSHSFISYLSPRQSQTGSSLRRSEPEEERIQQLTQAPRRAATPYFRWYFYKHNVYGRLLLGKKRHVCTIRITLCGTCTRRIIDNFIVLVLCFVRSKLISLNYWIDYELRKFLSQYQFFSEKFNSSRNAFADGVADKS